MGVHPIILVTQSLLSSLWLVPSRGPSQSIPIQCVEENHRGAAGDNAIRCGSAALFFQNRLFFSPYQCRICSSSLHKPLFAAIIGSNDRDTLEFPRSRPRLLSLQKYKQRAKNCAIYIRVTRITAERIIGIICFSLSRQLSNLIMEMLIHRRVVCTKRESCVAVNP